MSFTLVIFFGMRTALSVGIIAMIDKHPPDPSIPVSTTAPPHPYYTVYLDLPRVERHRHGTIVVLLGLPRHPSHRRPTQRVLRTQVVPSRHHASGFPLQHTHTRDGVLLGVRGSNALSGRPGSSTGIPVPLYTQHRE